MEFWSTLLRFLPVVFGGNAWDGDGECDARGLRVCGSTACGIVQPLGECPREFGRA